MTVDSQSDFFDSVPRLTASICLAPERALRICYTVCLQESGPWLFAHYILLEC
jgi:hypothetical protein